MRIFLNILRVFIYTHVLSTVFENIYNCVIVSSDEHWIFLYGMYQSGVAIINAKFQIRQRHYHQCSKPPKFNSANAANNQCNLTLSNLT